MKILLFNWYDNSSHDACECLLRLGHAVAEIKYQLTDKFRDEQLESSLGAAIVQHGFEAVFSFDYFPVLSDIAERTGIKYISWVYDSPHNTLYAKNIFNKCNYIFCFDSLDAGRLRQLGVQHAYHMPLAANVGRLDALLGELSVPCHYDYDISFVGSLYRGRYNFYDSIKMPEYYRGFYDGLMQSQMELYGCDIVSQLVTDSRFEKISDCFSVEDDDRLFITKRDYFIQFVQKKITSIERVRALNCLADRYKVTLFSGGSDEELKQVEFSGYVDYLAEMPRIFRSSKINLNISLRSIVSGIPLRCIDIMAAGGFLLSNYQPELEELFTDGEDMVMYTSMDDLKDKAGYYLEHDEERRRIALNGWKKVHEKFGMEDALRKILEMTSEENVDECC